MDNYINDKKFEAIKYRHEDQVKRLQYLTDVENQFLRGFFTIQLVFGGFLSQTTINKYWPKLGLLLIDIALGLICCAILIRSKKRRKEVTKIIKNCNEALKYDEEGYYLENKTVNTKVKDSYNLYTYYCVIICITIVGIFIILFFRN